MLAGWGGMLALTALAAASEEQRALVQSVILTATPPSYRQLIADRQQKASSRWFMGATIVHCMPFGRATAVCSGMHPSQ